MQTKAEKSADEVIVAIGEMKVSIDRLIELFEYPPFNPPPFKVSSVELASCFDCEAFGNDELCHEKMTSRDDSGNEGLECPRIKEAIEIGLNVKEA